MTDYTELKRLAEHHQSLGHAYTVATPDAVLALIAENQALKGPHDWLAEDLIKELVDNAQAIQENADDGEEDQFVIVLLAAASRIRRQEASLDQLRTENKRLVPFEEAYATACNVRNRLIKDNELLDQLIVANKVISDSFRSERDQLKAENEALRLALESCADELEGQVIQCYHGQPVEDMHPVVRRSYDRDMLCVTEARAAMGKGEQS